MNLEEYEEAIHNSDVAEKLRKIIQEEWIHEPKTKAACRRATEEAVTRWHRIGNRKIENLITAFQRLQDDGYIKEFNVESGFNKRYEMNFYFHWSPYKNTYELE